MEGPEPRAIDSEDGTKQIPVIRIFVSSPGDVAEERAVALSVMGRLQARFQGRLIGNPGDLKQIVGQLIILFVTGKRHRAIRVADGRGACHAQRPFIGRPAICVAQDRFPAHVV